MNLRDCTVVRSPRGRVTHAVPAQDISLGTLCGRHLRYARLFHDPDEPPTCRTCARRVNVCL